jgi:glycine/D-amino acid oxidase-like deaminating enzyme
VKIQKNIAILRFIWLKFVAIYKERLKEVDIIIVGAGLAGTSLALELSLRKQNLLVVDLPNPNSSSRVAAGIVNPVVPKGVRTTWQYHAFFKAIPAYFAYWEKQLNASFFNSLPGFQIHPDGHTASQWQKRYSHPEMQAIIAAAEPDSMDNVNHPFGATRVNHCAKLKTQAFLTAAKNWLSPFTEWDEEAFLHASLIRVGNEWHYHNWKAKAVVFCEGINVLNNPWFRHLHFHPTAGDLLTIRFEQAAIPKALYKNREWLIPDGAGNWLVGSTFHKGSLDETPKKEDAEMLLQRLQQWVSADFTLVKHLRGIRPTVEGRRPYLGEHNTEKGLFIYNGLGSKGSSLISWLSPMMADYLVNKQPLHAEVDINRYG